MFELDRVYFIFILYLFIFFNTLGALKASSILSFGYGPYNCIGKTFALLEMRVMIARLLQKFSFTLDDEYNEKFKKRKQFLAVRTDPSFIIRFHNL